LTLSGKAVHLPDIMSLYSVIHDLTTKSRDNFQRDVGLSKYNSVNYNFASLFPNSRLVLC